MEVSFKKIFEVMILKMNEYRKAYKKMNNKLHRLEGDTMKSTFHTPKLIHSSSNEKHCFRENHRGFSPQRHVQIN